MLRALVVVCSAALFQACSGMYISIAAGSSKCFYELLHTGDKFAGIFEEAVDGAAGIDVRISDPKDNTLFSLSDKRNGRFSITANGDGDYKLCFNNHASSSGKVLSFATHVGEHAPHDAATKESAEGVSSALADLLMLTYEVNDAQRFMRTRDELRDAVTDSMADRVVYAAFVELLAILVIAYWQVRTLKGFFEVRAHV